MSNKIHFFIAASVVAATVLSACSGGGDGGDNDRGETAKGNVSFNVSVSGFQNGNGSIWSFQQGNQIGIYAVAPSGNINLQEQGNYANNVCFFWDGANFKPAHTAITKAHDQELAYYAVCPYTATAGRQMSYTIETNQTTSNALAKSDFCTAFVGLTSAMNVPLVFQHRMSRVRVNVTGEHLMGTVTKVVLKDVWLTLSANLNTDSYATTTDWHGDVIMQQSANDKNTFYAIIPPQTLPASRTFLVATADGRDMNVDFTTDEILTSGYERTLTVYRKSDATPTLTVLDGQITPWSEE